jgi:hypothetical protein
MLIYIYICIATKQVITSTVSFVEYSGKIIFILRHLESVCYRILPTG